MGNNQAIHKVRESFVKEIDHEVYWVWEALNVRSPLRQNFYYHNHVTGLHGPFIALDEAMLAYYRGKKTPPPGASIFSKLKELLWK